MTSISQGINKIYLSEGKYDGWDQSDWNREHPHWEVETAAGQRVGPFRAGQDEKDAIARAREIYTHARFGKVSDFKAWRVDTPQEFINHEIQAQKGREDWDARQSMKTESKKKKKPCWKNYKMVGTKEKNGKTVPNCVPESANLEEAKKAIKNPHFKKIVKYLKSNFSSRTLAGFHLDDDSIFKEALTRYDLGHGVIRADETGPLEVLFRRIEVQVWGGFDEGVTYLDLEYSYEHYNGGRNGKRVRLIDEGDGFNVDF